MQRGISMTEFFPEKFRGAPGIIVCVLFFSMLFSPGTVFDGACEGLLLWFRIVFPTLFPFILISDLLLRCGGLKVISDMIGYWIGKIFSVSRDGSFAVLAGFLCGYPMGAKITADLYRNGNIGKKEASYLLSFCNNTSPVFIINYIVKSMLKDNSLLLPSLFILYSVPVLLSFIFRFIYRHKEYKTDRTYSRETPVCRSKAASASVFDDCIMDAFESIVKVGGYIIFFSILIRLIQKAEENIPIVFCFLPFLEITQGIHTIAEAGLTINISYPFIMAVSAFGGICSIAQTACMIRGTGLGIYPYIIQKLAAATAASLMALWYINW